MQEEWSPDFPIHLYHSGMVLPKEGNYFVIAGDGIWLHKDTGICQCFVPVENISCLDNLNAKTSVSVNLPKLPIKFVELSVPVEGLYVNGPVVSSTYNKDDGPTILTNGI